MQFANLVVIEEAADIALSQRVEQGPCFRLFVEYGQLKGHFVHELVLANLTDVQAQLGDALVDVVLASPAAPSGEGRQLIKLSGVGWNVRFAFDY